MEGITAENIVDILRVSTQQAQRDVENFLVVWDQCEERLGLSEWKVTALKLIENKDLSTDALKKVQKVFKPQMFKAGRSFSLPMGRNVGPVTRKSKLLNACLQQLHPNHNDVSMENGKTVNRTRGTKSLARINPHQLHLRSKNELLTMQTELTAQYDKFLCDALKTKPAEELLLESRGVKSKIFSERSSLNGSRFPSLKSEIDAKTVDEQSSLKQENDLSSHKINITFEAPQEMVNATITITDEQPVLQDAIIKPNILNTKHLSEDSKTPIGKHTLNVPHGISLLKDSCPSNTGTPVIKKKNLTSYLNAKSVILSLKSVNTPSLPASDNDENDFVVPTKSNLNDGMPKRTLRPRPVSKDKVSNKKTTKRARVKDSPDEVKSKRKQREDCVKQQKLDLQLKKDEKKQQREERMRKTKEAREKLEQERRNKIQSSDEKKQVNKELDCKKGNTRMTRQASKKQITKQNLPTLKVPRKTRKSGPVVTKNQKLKKPCLTTVNETESEPEPVSSSSSKQTSNKILLSKHKTPVIEQNITSQNGNSTFTLKQCSGEALKAVRKEPDNSSQSKQKIDDGVIEQEPLSCITNTTFTASKSPDEEVIKKTPVAPFKKPIGTPSSNSKGSAKHTSGNPDKSTSIVNYEMTPYQDDDDEDSFDEDDLKKPIPSWASGIRLKEAIIKQACYPPNLDKLFGKISQNVNLVDIFGSQRRKQYKKRTSSAVWRNISFNIDI